MTLETRELYSSANGDRWSLAHDDGSERVLVVHQANLPSGGKTTLIEVGEFLMSGQGPEQQELLRLIATLVKEA